MQTSDSKLIDKLMNFVSNKDGSNLDITKLEIKPEEFTNFKNKDQNKLESSLEKIEKENNSLISTENKIICDNILMTFFDLNDEKFLACLQRINDWGFEICFREFILYYYIKVIRDNKLRHYILMNMNTILALLKENAEKSIIKGIKNFNFTNTDNDQEIELIKNDIMGKEGSLVGITVKNFKEFAPIPDETQEKLDAKARKSYRMEVLNRLRSENQKLLE